MGRYADSGLREPVYLVRRKDGQVAQLSELLYLLVQEADGGRPLNELASCVSKRSARALGTDAAAHLIDRHLRPNGLLLTTDAEPDVLPRADPLLALRLRIAALPPAAVRRIVGPLRPLFHRAVVLGALIALAALDGYLLASRSVTHVLASLVSDPVGVIVVGALAIAGVLAHELGHATGCRYAGGSPGAIGVGVYIVWPVLYCDLTDTYRLDRRGRLCADVGGMYFSALWALAAGIGYLLTGYEPLLVLIFVQHLEIATQALPLLRFDGHYILSDLAGVPDALSRVRPALASLRPGRPPHPSIEALTPAARRVIRAYALITGPAVVALLGLVALNAPALVHAAADAVAEGGADIATAWGSHDPAAGAVGFVRVLFAGLPVAGLAYTLVLVLGRVVRSIPETPRVLVREVAAGLLLGTVILYLFFYLAIGSAAPGTARAPAVAAIGALVAWGVHAWSRHRSREAVVPYLRQARERRGF